MIWRDFTHYLFGNTHLKLRLQKGPEFSMMISFPLWTRLWAGTSMYLDLPVWVPSLNPKGWYFLTPFVSEAFGTLLLEGPGIYICKQYIRYIYVYVYVFVYIYINESSNSTSPRENRTRPTFPLPQNNKTRHRGITGQDHDKLLQLDTARTVLGRKPTPFGVIQNQSKPSATWTTDSSWLLACTRNLVNGS